MKGSISIGCDRCRRFLGSDGNAHHAESKAVLSFNSIPEADRAANESGWIFKTIFDKDDDPVVLCPNCQRRKSCSA
jgi:hypothetical protein